MPHAHTSTVSNQESFGVGNCKANPSTQNQPGARGDQHVRKQAVHEHLQARCTQTCLLAHQAALDPHSAQCIMHATAPPCNNRKVGHCRASPASQPLRHLHMFGCASRAAAGATARSWWRRHAPGARLLVSAVRMRRRAFGPGACLPCALTLAMLSKAS